MTIKVDVMLFFDGEEYLSQERAGKKKMTPVEWEVNINPHKDLNKVVASFEITIDKEKKLCVSDSLPSLSVSFSPCLYFSLPLPSLPFKQGRCLVL
jgi:hypothetical protein